MISKTIKVRESVDIIKTTSFELSYVKIVLARTYLQLLWGLTELKVKNR